MKAVGIILPITLFEKQLQVDQSKARFKIAKCGRRGGKTRYGGYWLAKNALTNPGLHWHVNKTMDLVRDEVWGNLIEMIPSQFVGKIEERLLKITLNTPRGRSTIVCKSGEKEDGLRGRGLKSLWVDEASFMRQTLFDNVLRPTLADYRAPALITSSARKGWFTRQWKKADAGELRDWEAFKWTIYDNPHIDNDEIEDIKLNTPGDVWEEEYMANESDRSGVVLSDFDNRNIFNPLQKFQDISKSPCVVGMDWAYSKTADAAQVWIHVSPEGFIVATRENVKSGMDVRNHAKIMHGISRGLDIGYGDYCLDRSAFRLEGTSGVSIADQFRDCGIVCSRSQKDVAVGFDILRRMIHGNSSYPYLYISQDCHELITAIKTHEHGDHEPDVLAAFRYGVSHIVHRKMTALAELAQYFKGTALDDNDEPQPLPPGRVRLPNFTTKPVEFAWDYDAGGFA